MIVTFGGFVCDLGEAFSSAGRGEPLSLLAYECLSSSWSVLKGGDARRVEGDSLSDRLSTLPGRWE